MLHSQQHIRVGFSLIELSVVLALLALIASLTILKLNGPLKQTQLRSIRESLARIDRQARTHSRETPATVRIDLDKQRIGLDGANAEPLTLLPPARITAMLLGASRYNTGTVRVVYHRGQCETFALLVASKNGTGYWTVTSGITGQSWSVADDETSSEALEEWFSAWNDAH